MYQKYLFTFLFLISISYCAGQNSQTPSPRPPPPRFWALAYAYVLPVIQSSMSVGTVTKGFCTCDSSPKSAGLKTSRWAPPNRRNPWRLEVRDTGSPKLKVWEGKNSRCWPEVEGTWRGTRRPLRADSQQVPRRRGTEFCHNKHEPGGRFFPPEPCRRTRVGRHLEFSLWGPKQRPSTPGLQNWSELN